MTLGGIVATKWSNSCMFRLVVPLEGEPPSQSEMFLSYTPNRFSSRISLYLAPSIFPSSLTSYLIPDKEKQLHCIILPPPCLTVGMVWSGCYLVFMSYLQWLANISVRICLC
ncbi:hypothetical protein GOODEAATRI_023513 [Goodea atripinnis]|uniref:Uncharacterized protein n=1 Tax=Goodea atripinnis TaxID=208336 RepID=A0ABV0PGI7_9TELE